MVEGCIDVERDFVQDHISLYYNAYYCFRVIFIHIAPCCILVVLNALLVLTIRQVRDQLITYLLYFAAVTGRLLHSSLRHRQSSATTFYTSLPAERTTPSK